MARVPSSSVLVAVLHWGLGHATRSIPVIEALLARGAAVCIAGSASSGRLLQKRFPALPYYELPDYGIRYPGKTGMTLAMIRNLPSIYRAIRREKELVANIVAERKVELIISDNRYGARHECCKNILLTHQLTPLLPAGSRFLSNAFLKKFNGLLQSFDTCWIPDTADRFYSGKLSETRVPHNDIRFTGPLSRFAAQTGQSHQHIEGWLAVISGPEPQRSLFEKAVRKAARQAGEKLCIVAGRPGEHIQGNGNVSIHAHLEDKELARLILSAPKVVMRSGYSSIMDLYTLGKRALLVPTPGQTEQEYLAEMHSAKGHFIRMRQDHLDLKRAEALLANCLPMPESYRGTLLDDALAEVLAELQLTEELIPKRQLLQTDFRPEK